MLNPLSITQWEPVLSDSRIAAESLERGDVLFFPSLSFLLTPQEQPYLRPDCVDQKGKSIKYSAADKKLWGATENNSIVLEGLLQRYAEATTRLVTALFPRYAAAMTIGNTSFRPVEADGRVQSKRHDDRLLHVDAFPSRPLGGVRILRVFSNVHPEGRVRVWRIGEPFEEVAARFLPRISSPFPGSSWMMKKLGLTKTLRTPYDYYMCKLHDSMKFDDAYQRQAVQETVAFPAGSSWIVFSDQVSHAALSGQHALEQTFTLPVAALHCPELSPINVLERMKNRKLA